MDINSTEFAEFMRDSISELVDIEISKYFKDNNIMITWVGTVDTVDAGNNTADILLPNQTVAITKQNKTNQTLSAGEEVYLYSQNGLLSNSYIGCKKAKYV